jgi:RNA polymerase sigma-70 factor (ECF subfamily)
MKTERQIRNLLYRAKESLRNILEKEGFRYDGI